MLKTSPENRRSQQNFLTQTSNVFGIEEVLKTDNAENFSAKTKDDESENPKKKLKDISNTDKDLMNKR